MRTQAALGWFITGCLLLLLLLSIASAQHSATLTLSPGFLYETQGGTFNFSVNNFGSQHSISQVTGSLGGFTVRNVTTYSDWKNNFTANSIQWYGGLINNNVINAMFQFAAAAPNVDANQTYTFTFLTNDTASATQTHTMQFTIINDATGPALSNQSLSDGAAILQGAAKMVGITAEDAETGVASVQFQHRACSASNASTISLSPSGSSYGGVADFTSYADSTRVCFTYTGASNGGAAAALNGTALIDGTAPSINLTLPSAGSFINGNAQFMFVATDNAASALSCLLLIDDAAATAPVSVPNNTAASFSAADGTDGSHTWNVQCTDSVGLSGKGAARQYTLDKTPPNVTVSSPANNSVIAAGTLISVGVSDSYGVSSVTYTANGNSTTTTSSSFTVDTASWGDGPSVLAVTASDNAGNIGTTLLNFIVDRTPPVVTLAGPSGSVDVHVNFTYSAADTYDQTLLCELFVNNVRLDSRNITAGASSFQKIISPSTFPWRVDCTDDANNRGSSATNTLTTIDQSGPDMVITPVEYVLRGDSIVVTANITDPSSLANVTASLIKPDGTVEQVSPSVSGTVYTVTYPTASSTPTGNYAVAFSATDVLGFGSSATESFLVTYKVNIQLTLDPSSTAPSGTVLASGTVIDDTNTVIPESSLLIFVGNSTSAVVSRDPITGAYNYSFTAPSSPGTYNITAQVTSAGNGVTYSKTAVLTVASASSSDSSSGSSPTLSRDSGIDVGALAGNYRPPQRDAPATESTIIQGAAPEEPAAGEGTAEPLPPSGDAGDVNGIGSATGFFNLGRLTHSTLFWTILVFLIIIGALALASRTGSFRSSIREMKGGQHPAKQMQRAYSSGSAKNDGSTSLDEYLRMKGRR